jgi:tetratricopeptide (TPR) repeat protein
MLKAEEEIKLTKEEIKNMNEIFNYENSKKILSMLEPGFKKTTGDNNYDEYLKIATKDELWKKANYYYVYKYKDSKIVYKGKDTEVKTRGYEKALEFFKESVEKNPKNILSAYQGFRILEEYFLYFGANKVTNKYLKVFAEPLMKKEYCVGYLYTARSMKKEYGSDSNYEKIVALLDKGKKSCNKKDIPEYYIKGMDHEYALSKTMITVNQEKGKSK